MAFYGHHHGGGGGGYGGGGGGYSELGPLAALGYLPSRLAWYAMIANRHHQRRRKHTDDDRRTRVRARERANDRAVRDLRRLSRQAERTRERLAQRDHRDAVRSYHSYTKGVQREQHSEWKRQHPRIRTAVVRSIDRYVQDDALCAPQPQTAPEPELGPGTQQPSWAQVTHTPRRSTSTTSSTRDAWAAAIGGNAADESSANEHEHDQRYHELLARTHQMSAYVRAKYGTPGTPWARPVPAPSPHILTQLAEVQDEPASAEAPPPPPPARPLYTAGDAVLASQPIAPEPQQYDRALLQALDAWMENEWPGKQQQEARRAFILAQVQPGDTFATAAERILRARAGNLS